jgi:hypothetical protein
MRIGPPKCSFHSGYALESDFKQPAPARGESLGGRSFMIWAKPDYQAGRRPLSPVNCVETMSGC